MEPLKISATENTPSVTMDGEQQIFLIEGESYPESAIKFYTPIIEWLTEYEKILSYQKQYFERNRRMTFQFRLDYFNSTSAKYIHQLISQLDKMALIGLEVRVKWFYEKQDTDMKESGDELAKDFSKIQFKMLATDKQSNKHNIPPKESLRDK